MSNLLQDSFEGSCSDSDSCSSSSSWLFGDYSSSDQDDDAVKLCVDNVLKRGKRRCGRPSYHETFPELVPFIRSFVQQNSAAAHLRRRDDVMYTNGVTLKEIAKQVRQSLGIIVSKDTVHRLMLPRRKLTTASKYFKCLINARIPPKNNSGEKKIHPDFHYTCAQVSLINQMATYCSKGTLCMSVDNKNKVEVGNLAVNRRNQIRTFYLKEDAPVYNDHDFPHRNCKLTPAGYQVLTFKPVRSRSLSPPHGKALNPRRRCLSESEIFGEVKINKKGIELTKDRIGRDKVKWPRSGPLTVQIYPSRLIESTNVMHVNFLGNFLKSKMPGEVFNLIAIADGGPDWSVKGLINLMSLGYLWKNSKLDTLVIQCYAPGHSRFNPIERSWSQLTKWLVGVSLPIEMDGQLPKENDEEGWLKALDNAAVICSKFWDKKHYAGFEVAAKTFLSDNDLVVELKNCHSLFHQFTNASAKKIRETPHFQQLQRDYQFLVRHCNRKAYQIEFLRCQDVMCNHCSTLPRRDNEFLELINRFGGACPTPETSAFNKDHYITFFDHLRLLKIRSPTKSYVTSCNNTTQKNSVCQFGCSYVFFSKADEKRHNRLMNHVVPRKRNSTKRKHR